MRRALLPLAILYTALLSTSALCREKVELRAEFTAAAEDTKFKWGSPEGHVAAVTIFAFGQQPRNPVKTEAKLSGDIFNSGSATSNSKDCLWVLVSVGKDGKPHEVKYKLQRKENSAHQISGVILFPETEPNKDNKYYIHLRENASLSGVLKGDPEITNEKKFLNDPIPDKYLEDLLTYVDGNKALVPNISVKTGKNSTVAVKLYYGQQVFKGESKIRFQSILDAELSYQPKVKDQYVNQVNAELDLLYDTAPWNFVGDWINGLTEIGITTRLETDQRFDNVDETFGVTSYTPLNGKIFQGIADLLCLNGKLGGNAPSALLNLSYDYVANLKNDVTTGTRTTHVSTDRARARFYWSLKLLKDLDWRGFFATKDIYDVSLIVDCGIAYDRQNSAFLPETNLTLEIGPSDPKSNNISFIVTYANGKTKERFENYNGVLAGLKKTF